ncbi:hypothetical protein [Streptomyces sp. NPDC006285]|uniref:hypothetical protein n=1 Tax=Streptomyces sp. NPDC006285 TaxID=3364742 RepID=UPI0036B92C05
MPEDDPDAALQCVRHRRPGPGSVASGYGLHHRHDRLSHLLENIGAEEVRFSRDELQELNAAVARITIHGDRLPPDALAMAGVEAVLR